MKRALLVSVSVLLLLMLCACGGDKAEANTNQQTSAAVYITNSGTKYHKDGCQFLSKSKKPIALDKAKAKGYTACSKCNPEG